MISTVLAFQRRGFRGRPDIDKGDRVRREARRLGKGRPHHARGIARRVADLAAGKILRAVHARALEPVEGLAGIGIDAHQRDRIGALAAGDQHGRKIRNAERRAARADLERRNARSLADLDAEIDPGLLVPALRFRIIKRRVIRGRGPVQDQADALAGHGRCGWRGSKREQQPGKSRATFSNCRLSTLIANLFRRYSYATGPVSR